MGFVLAFSKVPTVELSTKNADLKMQLPGAWATMCRVLKTAQNMQDLNFTHILESVRRKFDISRDEYALVNYIQTWSAHPGNKNGGWCDRSRDQMAEFIGISDRGIMKMLDRMEGKGLIERLSKTMFKHRISKIWFEAVSIENREEKGEQSSSFKRTKFLKKENKVPLKGEQSSPEKENKVPPHIYIDNKSINTTTINAACAENSVWFADINKLAENALNDDLFKERVQIRKPGVDLQKELARFVADQMAIKSNYHSDTAFRNHFLNWVAKRPDEKPQESKPQPQRQLYR